MHMCIIVQRPVFVKSKARKALNYLHWDASPHFKLSGSRLKSLIYGGPCSGLGFWSCGQHGQCPYSGISPAGIRMAAVRWGMRKVTGSCVNWLIEEAIPAHSHGQAQKAHTHGCQEPRQHCWQCRKWQACLLPPLWRGTARPSHVRLRVHARTDIHTRTTSSADAVVSSDCSM